MKTPIASYPLDRYLWDSSRGRGRLHAPFTYQGEVSFVAIGDQTMVIDMDTDGPFAWVGLRAASFFPATAIPTDPFDAAVMVRYGGRGGSGFAQTPIDIRNCAPPRPVPFVLPCIKLLPKGSQLNVTVTLRSLPGVTPANLALQFFGFKVFTWRGKP
jgi:hypothetical protein